MMNDKDLNKYIDEYYSSRESHGKLNIQDNSEASFLYSSLEKMDIIKDDNSGLDIDIMGVISQGEEIVQKKKDRWEFILFLVCGISLILLFASACLLINGNIFIYLELAITALIPFALIPLSYVKVVKGEY